MILGYIDPGAGSMFVQALVAAIIGVPILFRRQVARVATVLRRSRKAGPVAGDDVNPT